MALLCLGVHWGPLLSKNLDHAGSATWLRTWSGPLELLCHVADNLRSVSICTCGATDCCSACYCSATCVFATLDFFKSPVCFLMLFAWPLCRAEGLLSVAQYSLGVPVLSRKFITAAARRARMTFAVGSQWVLHCCFCLLTALALHGEGCRPTALGIQAYALRLFKL